MNNSKFLIDSLQPPVVQDKTEVLREMEGRTARILKALEEIQNTEAWSSLKELVFDDLTKRLKSELLREAKKEGTDVQKLARLAGQLQWAERYSDLSKFYAETRLELTRIKALLHAK